MNHTPPIFIEEGTLSTAFLTVTIPQTLVIFVHGLNGRSVDSWGKFPELIRNNADFKFADVIFYGYDSLKHEASYSAKKLYSSLKILMEKSPNDWSIERKEIPDFFQYKNIVLVAHSLGAVVLRKALILAKNESNLWLENCKMILFAPAHHGIKKKNFIIESLSSIENILSGLGYITLPILEDIKPNSLLIKNLIKESLTLLNNKQGNFTIADKIIWCNQETVVCNEQFGKDPSPLLIENKSHITICKPDSTYLTPYHIVAKSLYA